MASDAYAFNTLDIVVISCLVFLFWIILILLGYHAYQVMYLEDDEGDLDDSSNSANLFLSEHGSSSHGGRNMDMPEKMRKFVVDFWTYFKKRHLTRDTMYDLNVLKDSENKKLIETTILKGDLGLGLDIKRESENRTVVTGFKKFPSWTSNPSQFCDPPIKVGDYIIAINGEIMDNFSKIVLTMKECPNGEVALHLRRPKVKKAKKVKKKIRMSEL